MNTNKYDFKDVQKAFINGSISLKSFAEVLVENFDKKKARKILRKNLEPILRADGIPKQQIEEYLMMVSLLVDSTESHQEYQQPLQMYGSD